MKKFTRERAVADHVRQRFLADFGNYRIRRAFLAERSQQQQGTG